MELITIHALPKKLRLHRNHRMQFVDWADAAPDPLRLSSSNFYVDRNALVEGAVIQSPDDAPPRPVNDDVTVVNMR